MTARPAPRRLPDFRSLPRLPIGIPHAWEVFGPDDNLGTLNLLDADTVRGAMSEVVTGTTIGLTLELGVLDPPLYGREALRHQLIEAGRNEWDDRLDSLYPQASSQWDGLLHIRCREFGFYGGLTASPPDLDGRLGIGHWSDGIVGRGVLLDLHRHFAATRTDYHPHREIVVTAADLEEVAAAQDVQIRRGDILCLRFGWTTGYRQLSRAERSALAARGTGNPFAGLSAEESMAERLWDWHLAAIVADNPALEASPGDPAVGSLHRRLLPTLGFAIGELFDLDRLARACADESRWTFAFVAAPLNIRGGVASPANAIAIR